MKHIKNFLYLFFVFGAAGIVLCISAGIVQFGTGAITNRIGITLNDEWLVKISGGLGTAITGTLYAFYVKKKNYTDCIETKEPFQIKKCLYYGAIAYSVCGVLFYAVTTVLFVYVFSMTNEVHVVVEKSWSYILWQDVFFPILSAPIFEELLFRKGLYSLVRQRFGKKFSVLICTLVFAAIHGYSLQGFCACLVGGLCFMLIYVSTGNIWYSITAHMVCNLDSAVFNALEDKKVTFLGIPMQYEIDGFNMVHPVLIFIAVLICILCIIKKVKNASQSMPMENKAEILRICK